ncbi:hypothetical protein ACFQ4C_12035 [Larkinella insperata]|uniref:DUF2383 domain-containing protein n=1 Tax=Larkinella insperata TaxID=332158 RepID=A0ABW3QA47_9BACT|nr:hypothetical protein [Larkinella insperata]
MITVIKTAQSLLDLNGAQRGLCSQLQKKTLGTNEFVNAFNQLHERAKECGMKYYSRFSSFAPLFVDHRQLEQMQSAMADLMDRSELQAEADLLRSGVLPLEDHLWHLRWHFLLERAGELGYYWNSEEKRFN